MSECYCEKYPVFVCSVCVQKNEIYDLEEKNKLLNTKLEIATYHLLHIATIYERPTEMKSWARVALKKMDGAR